MSMNKYGTPQSVTHDGDDQIVSERPLKPCCEKMVAQVKQASADRQPHSADCPCCHNKIEVSKE